MDVLAVARALSARRSVKVAAAAAVACGAGFGFLPLLSLPGFELSLFGCLAMAVAGGPLGIAAARRANGAVLRPWAGAALVAVGLLVLLFGASALQAVLRSRCDPLAGIAFLPVLALPSALLATAFGFFCGSLAKGKLAGVLYALGLLASLAWTLRAPFLGPQAFAFDHFLGYWPGPLYDEALRVEGKLLAFRALTLAWTGLCLAACAPPRPRSVLAGIAAAAALLGGHRNRSALGYDVTREHLASVLSGTREGKRCLLHFAGDKPGADAERLSRQCEHDAAEVARALGIADPPRVAVWVYRSADEKRRLTGASHTDFTKPWLLEVHVNDEGLPHPVLRHELAHALAATFADGPLKVPARLGVLVSAGLVEGLAMAVEAPRGEWTLHEQARAMKELSLLPSPVEIVGPAGFFGAPPARAYATAGSFLGFLLEREGPDKLRLAYRTGDLAAAYGVPLPELEARWTKFLEGIPVTPELRAWAELRFKAGSIFARPCAREVAELGERAERESAAGRVTEAAALYRRAAALSGDDTAWRRREGDLWRRVERFAEAEAAYGAVLEKADAASRASLQAILGDLRWRAGDLDGARARYLAAAETVADRGEGRLLAAKLAALGDPRLAEGVGRFLLGTGDFALATARLAGLAAEPRHAALADYLLGRLYLQRGDARAAREPLLRAAAAGGLPSPAFELELRRMLAQDFCDLGEWDHGIAGFRQLESMEGAREADRLAARDAASACAFERDEYRKPVAAPAPF